MAEDYYSILGVQKGCSSDEIKKAYRKLAMQYHPDRNPGDKAAEEKFKSINEAYSVLSDDKKRQQYDQMGHQMYTQGGGGGMGGMRPEDIFSSVFGNGDFFSSFFGGGGRRRPDAPEPGEDFLYELRIGFEEAMFGVDKDISLNREESCSSCHGSGAEPGTSRKKCPQCGGSGQVTMSLGGLSIRQPCRACGGQGSILEKPCRTCRGTGTEKKRKTLTVHIPAGVDTGSRLRLSGEGGMGKRGGPRGDLYVELTVGKHDIFVRDNDNILCDVPIPFHVAALGGVVTVPTISGSEEVKIPAGIQSGTRLLMKGKGAPSLNSRRGRGDQILRIIVETPASLSSKQKELLQQFAETVKESSNYAKTAAFKDKAKRFCK